MHPRLRRLAASSGLLAATLLLGTLAPGRPALAQHPVPWEIGMQPAFSPIKQDIIELHDLVQVIITVITLFVAVLLAYVMFRYHHTRNPTPSRLSHHTWLEVTWTLAPVLILVAIAIPSFRLVYYEDRTATPDLTVKVTGHQWYWEYTYPDQNGLHFDSYIVPENQLKPGQMRLLEVDNQLVLPAGKRIRILETSADVIHSFFIPSLGVQRYAMPGRTIETWVEITRPGVYYGECNQVCGTNHSQMPISVHAVTPDEFTAWLAQAKTKFSQGTAPAQTVAAAAAPSRLAVAQVEH
ncbi:MAG: cytochrome c oxidase subunit II [Acidisphaera sp.]|nr:cytochrome c oxidase subunit II [Acidisphaera sp.]